MNYKEAMDYVEQVNQRGSRYGLETMKLLLKELGNPERKLSFIHIGGTNGKGSVSTYIASVLVKNNKRIGRYVSPTVFSYQEKIQYIEEGLQHEMTEEETAWSVTCVAKAVQTMKNKNMPEPTVFEIETAMSFLLFLKWKVDLVVLEVGMGGLLDATNVVENVVCSVLTSIGLDHMAILGDTIEKITEQKAGIIKKGAPLFTCQKNVEVLKYLENVCEQKKSPFYSVDKSTIEVQKADLSGTDFSYHGKEYHTRMAGIYQVENATLAIAVCEYLEMTHIVDGIAEAKWPGRFETIQTKPTVILDGAHNIEGAKALRESICSLCAGRKIYGVFGVFADKDYVGIASEVVPLLTEVVTTSGEGARGLPPEKLAQVCQTYCDRVSFASTSREAFDRACEKAQEEDIVIVFGSLSFLKCIRR